MKKQARQKLKEKQIDWEQVYTDKTLFLKEQFEDVVGPGSYFRFEGEANDGDKYYCIIGPAKVHDPRAKFFAGVRKLPATYSAGGKYFDSMDAAASYALETWGVPTPKSLKPYTSAQLYGISDKIKKWKAEREEKEDDKEETEESKKESQMKFNLKLLKTSMSQEADKITKEAMGYTNQRNREDYTWWNMDDLGRNPDADPQFAEALETEPTLRNAFNEAQIFQNKMTAYFAHQYGLNPRAIGQIYKMFFGYHPVYGAYYCSIGPYKGPKAEGENRFSYFTKRMRKKDVSDIQESINNALKKYIRKFADAYDLSVEDFDASDFSVKINAAQPFDPNRKNQKNEVLLKADDFASEDTQRELEALGMGALSEGANEEEASNNGIFADPTFSFNPKGQTKILEKLAEAGNYSNLLGRAIQTVGNEINASPDEVRRTMENNKDTLQRVVKIVNELYSELGDEAVAMGISEPPVNISKDPLLKIQGKSGQQIPSALSTSKQMTRKMEFQMLVAELMQGGLTDPQEILASLGTDTVPVEYIQKIVDGINAERFETNESGEVQEVKTIETILEEQSERYQGLKEQYGFKTLQDAFKMAAEYFSSRPVDGITKHKIFMDEGEGMVFDPPADIIEINSEDLQRLRENRGTLTEEEISAIVDDTEGMASAKEILEEIGVDPVESDNNLEEEVAEDIEEREEKFDQLPQDAEGDDYFEETDNNLDDVEVSPTTEEVPQPQQVKPQPQEPSLDNLIDSLEDDEDYEDDEFQFDLDSLDASSKNRTIVTKTLNNLINIADKMDSKGDYENAEKVHLIIKKYMGE